LRINILKLPSRLIKNLLVPLDTLVRKRVRAKLAASKSKLGYIVQEFAKDKARGLIDPIRRIFIRKTLSS
jgi:hypothetical protein